MSLRPSISRSPTACSGDMYVGVPTAMPVAVSRVPPSIARAMPKSVTIARPLSAVEQNVVGLDVAMNDAAQMRVRQCVGDLGEDSPDFVDRLARLAREVTTRDCRRSRSPSRSKRCRRARRRRRSARCADATRCADVCASRVNRVRIAGS